MINFDFTISNPCSDLWKCIVSKNGMIAKNKAFEANVYRTNILFTISFRLSIRGDHAGLNIMGGALGLVGEFHFYDTRHWDYKTNNWKVYD